MCSNIIKIIFIVLILYILYNGAINLIYNTLHFYVPYNLNSWLLLHMLYNCLYIGLKTLSLSFLKFITLPYLSQIGDTTHPLKYQYFKYKYSNPCSCFRKCYHLFLKSNIIFCLWGSWTLFTCSLVRIPLRRFILIFLIRCEASK